MTTQVNEQELQTAINTEKRVLLIDFFAPWCGPCKAMSPALDAISKSMGDSVSVLKLNIDDNQAMAAKFRIRSIPSLVLMQDGEVLSAQVGGMSEAGMRKWIADTLPAA